MNTVTAVRDRILQLCAERGISINRLASLSALPPSSLKNILYGKSQNPKILTIKLLCDGLGITLGEFFSTPEFDALEQEPFRQVCARFLSALLVEKVSSDFPPKPPLFRAAVCGMIIGISTATERTTPL